MPAKTPEENRARVKAWNAANPERYRARMKAWHAANKDSANDRRRVRYAEHRDEELAGIRQRHIENRERYRASRLTKYQGMDITSKRAARLKKYRLTIEQYDARALSQGGACAICRIAPDEILFVDHDHVSGEVRGLLCRNCNFAIGLMKDSPETLHVAAEYLRQHARKASA